MTKRKPVSRTSVKKQRHRSHPREKRNQTRHLKDSKRPSLSRTLLKFERALLAEKQRIIRQCNYTDEIMESPSTTGDLSQHRTHLADQGTENYQREMASRFKSLEAQTLREIDEALERIATGTYGICVSCGGRISRARLAVVPHARLCMKCLRGRR